jgi:hypothetical protein
MYINFRDNTTSIRISEKGYISLLEALVSSRLDDPHLQGLLDDYQRRVLVDQVAYWSEFVLLAGSLDYTACALVHGLVIGEGNWVVGHIFLGPGIGCAEGILGGSLSRNIPQHPALPSPTTTKQPPTSGCKIQIEFIYGRYDLFFLHCSDLYRNGTHNLYLSTVRRNRLIPA